MKVQERRENILTTLKGTKEAISASTLAKIFSVSRQVIVGDIALLRAQQCDIISTPKGYLMSSALSTHQFTARLVCQHGIEQTEEELEIILRYQGIIMNVEVEHPIYGMLTAPLNIQSQKDIDNFTAKLKVSNAELLSSLTDGLHTHMISCQDQSVFD
ncbi:TPA: transcription repressor NadR [Streptococcus agalactiae]